MGLVGGHPLQFPGLKWISNNQHKTKQWWTWMNPVSLYVAFVMEDCFESSQVSIRDLFACMFVLQNWAAFALGTRCFCLTQEADGMVEWNQRGWRRIIMAKCTIRLYRYRLLFNPYDPYQFAFTQSLDSKWLKKNTIPDTHCLYICMLYLPLFTYI